MAQLYWMEVKVAAAAALFMIGKLIRSRRMTPLNSTGYNQQDARLTVARKPASQAASQLTNKAKQPPTHQQEEEE